MYNHGVCGGVHTKHPYHASKAEMLDAVSATAARIANPSKSVAILCGWVMAIPMCTWLAPVSITHH